MSMNIRRDLNISGVLGGCSGGTFNKVTINGHGTVNGDLDCIGFTCNGKTSVRGKVTAEIIEVNGSASFGGEIRTGKLRINGKSEMEGAVSARNFRSDGHTKVGGDMTGEEVEINGSFKVNGNCDAERFRARGTFRIDGLLNAETIDIDLYAECRAREIGGESISVRKTGIDSPFGKLMKALIFPKDALIADTIEGDEVRLEYTTAGVVRGTNVTIGPGCHIGLVEYKDGYRRDIDAVVIESRQM
ncbi:polymer-forming cytoskeletal protein [Paenibacillus hemerocallicola]|nr:polymer-forming cytoskeletal protein [Paenibacillus hemerocallicola]